MLTFGLIWAVLALLLSCGALWACALLAIVASLRVSVALAVGWSALRDRQVLRFMALLPLRDVAALLIWLASLFGHKVIWRGDVFQLEDGKLVRIDP